MPPERDGTSEVRSLLAEIAGEMEDLRDRIMAAEAITNAAQDLLDAIPYLPRLPHAPRTFRVQLDDANIRRNLGRIQSLVTASAEATKTILTEAEAMVDRVQAHMIDSKGFDPPGSIGNTGTSSPNSQFSSSKNSNGNDNGSGADKLQSDSSDESTYDWLSSLSQKVILA